jgi:hypothetical protein
MTKDLKKLIKDQGSTVNVSIHSGNKKKSSTKHPKKLKNGQAIQRP